MDDGEGFEANAEDKYPGLDVVGADGLVLEPPKVQEIDLNLPKYARQVLLPGHILQQKQSRESAICVCIQESTWNWIQYNVLL